MPARHTVMYCVCVRMHADRVMRYGALLEHRKALEHEWRQMAASKAERDAGSARMRTSDPGLPIHEQCARYHRCAQCKRRLENCGETFVWRDTRYVPGARYIY